MTNNSFVDNGMSDEEKLKIAVDALERIAASDPGPAYYIAKAALKEINPDDGPDDE